MGYSSYRLHGQHFWTERIFEWFEHPSLQIEVAQIIIHKAHEPDVVLHFLDADGLAGEDCAEVDFLFAEADAPAVCHHDRSIVERIVDVGQALVGTRARPTFLFSSNIFMFLLVQSFDSRPKYSLHYP